MEHQKRDDDRQDAVTEGFGAPCVRTRNLLVPAPCHERLLSDASSASTGTSSGLVGPPGGPRTRLDRGNRTARPDRYLASERQFITRRQVLPAVSGGRW